MVKMIGARRNFVSIVVNTLRRSNCDRYSRGKVELNDLAGLNRNTCECYRAIKLQREKVVSTRHPPLKH